MNKNAKLTPEHTWRFTLRKRDTFSSKIVANKTEGFEVNIRNLKGIHKLSIMRRPEVESGFGA